MIHAPKKVLSSMVAIGFLSACATPDEIHQLATKTAANVGIISVHLRRLSQNSSDIAESRAAIISRLHAENVKIRAEIDLDIKLTKKTGGAANLALIQQIEDWTRDDDARIEKDKKAEAERNTRVLETQTKLAIETKALADIAQKLASLAKEDSSRDRVNFLKGYATDLKKELDKALKADNDSVDAARKLLENVKQELKDIN